MSNIQGSYSDPTLGHPGFATGEELSDEEIGAGGIVVDVVPQADDRSYKVQMLKSGSKGGESSSHGKDGERRRRSGRSRRKN
jgi:hypothetical protein